MLGGSVQNIWALLMLLSAKTSQSFTHRQGQGHGGRASASSSATGCRTSWPHFAIQREKQDAFRILPLDVIENLLDLEDSHDDHQHSLDDEEVLAPLEIKTKRSLYEILRAPKNATKVELKIQYLALARETHPDALIGRGVDTTTAEAAAASSFTEVAEAWHILSNPKDRRRYDRSLQTDELSDALAEKAVPMVAKVAATFLRRTTVTAVASFSAAAQDLLNAKNGSQIDFGHALSMGMKAGGAAGRMVDELELLEKVKELETRTLKESEQELETHFNGFVSQESALSTGLLVETERSSANQTQPVKVMERASVSSAKQLNPTESIISEVQAKLIEAIQDKPAKAEKERASVAKAKPVKGTERASEVEAIFMKATEQVISAKIQGLKEAEGTSEVQTKPVKAPEWASQGKMKETKETGQTSALKAKQVKANEKKFDEETTTKETISTAANIATSLGRKRKEVAQITTQSSEVLMNETIAALATTIRALERAEAFHEQVNADPEIETIADLEELKRALQGKRTGAAFNIFARKKKSEPSIMESIALLDDMKHTLEEAEPCEEEIKATSINETISVLEEMKRALEVETEQSIDVEQKLNASSKASSTEKVPKRLEGIGDYLKSRRLYKKKSEQ